MHAAVTNQIVYQSVHEIPHLTIYCDGLGSCRIRLHNAWKKIANYSCLGVVCYGKHWALCGHSS